MTETTQAVQVLTAQDRCDRCGAQGRVLVMLPSGGLLLFCAHHAHANAEGLSAAGATVVLDEREGLS